MAKVIVLFGTKGGVGKTFIAVNTAVCLAKDEAKKVCLIDLDMHVVGDMARMLDVVPQKAMIDLIGSLGQLQDVGFKKEDFMTRGSYGFDFLPGVLRPRQASHLETEGVKAVFKLLDKEYDYIIIDAGKNFSDVFVTVLNQANLILLVVTPDVLSIYQARWILDALQFLHFPLTMLKVILNRAESSSSIGWKDVGASLPIGILSMIPSEGKVVGQALNRAIPVVIDNPKSKIALEIKKVSHELVVNSKLFVENFEIDMGQLKEVMLEKSGEFWKSQGISEAPSEIQGASAVDGIILLKRRIHSRLIEGMNLKRLDLRAFSDQKKVKELREKAEMLTVNLIAEEVGSVIASPEVRKRLVKEILDEALGLGPLEDLIADPEITDIMVNNKDTVYVERYGKITLTDKKFISNEQLRTIIERIIAPLGRRIDESVPMVDARLFDGSRVNAIIPPLALTGPSLTIRKFRKEKFKVEELIVLKTFSREMAEFLKACVASRKNMIVSGGTGSGKTTMLNLLSMFIPEDERIITIEDAAELKLSQAHWIRLEARPSNIEGKGSVTARDLFKNTLRMRPDRIIIGECRGIETLDMLQAMNTGHDGSMTTIHANSTYDVLARLDSMILMSGIELPVRAIREMIASAVDIIVHTARLSDGSRKIVQIAEIIGMKDEVHIDIRDIFKFKQTGVDTQGRVLGEFKATGQIPTFLDEVKVKGIALSEDIFKAA